MRPWTALAIGSMLALVLASGLRAQAGTKKRPGFRTISRDWFATLDVRVLDDETGLAVPAASVTVPRLAYEAERTRGRFRFERLRKGPEPFEVLVAAPGYLPQRHEVVSPGENRLLTLVVRLKPAVDEAARRARPEVEVLRPRPGEILGGRVAVAARITPLASALDADVEMGFYDGAGMRCVSATAKRMHGAVWGCELDLSPLPAGPYRFYVDLGLDAKRGRVSHLVKVPNFRRAPATAGVARRPMLLRFIRPAADTVMDDRLIVMVACPPGDLPVAAVRFSASRIGGTSHVLGKGRPSKDGRRWGFSWRREGFLPGRYRVVATALDPSGKSLGSGKSALVRLR